MSPILLTKQVEKRQAHSDLELIKILSHDLKKKDSACVSRVFRSYLLTCIHFQNIYCKKLHAVVHVRQL